MELRHLKYFIVLAEELNFRRAAERIGIAQPPLSKQIRDLELELEAKLFERNQQRVLLTKAGKVFLKEVRLVMTQVDIAVTRVQKAHQGGAAKISIGFSAPAQQVLAKVLTALKNLTPELEISLQELTGLEQLSAIRGVNSNRGKGDRIDLALGYLPDIALLQRDGLEARAIQPEKFYLAVSEQYLEMKAQARLSTIEKSSSLQSMGKVSQMSDVLGQGQNNYKQPPALKFDLSSLCVENLKSQDQEGEKFIKDSNFKDSIASIESLSINILNSTTLILAQDQWGDFAEIRLLEVLDQINIKPQRIQMVSKVETALFLVSQNLGVTIIDSAINNFRRVGVIYVNLLESLISKDIGVIWRKDSSLGDLEKIVSSIKAELSEED